MKNIFEKIAAMVRNNDKRVQLATLANIHKMDIKGINGFVTFGVPPEVVYQLMDTKKQFVGGFLLIPKDALEEYQSPPQRAGVVG